MNKFNDNSVKMRFDSKLDPFAMLFMSDCKHHHLNQTLLSPRKKCGRQSFILRKNKITEETHEHDVWNDDCHSHKSEEDCVVMNMNRHCHRQRLKKKVHIQHKEIQKPVVPEVNKSVDWRDTNYWKLPENCRKAIDKAMVKSSHSDFYYKLDNLTERIKIFKTVFYDSRVPAHIKVYNERL